MTGTQPKDLRNPGNPGIPSYSPIVHDCAQKEHIDILSRQMAGFFRALEERDKNNLESRKELKDSIDALNGSLSDLQGRVQKREWSNGVQDDKIEENKKELKDQDKVLYDLKGAVKSLSLVAKLNAILLGALIVAVISKVLN